MGDRLYRLWCNFRCQVLDEPTPACVDVPGDPHHRPKPTLYIIGWSWQNTHYYVDLARGAGELEAYGNKVTLLAGVHNLRGLLRPHVIVLGPADMYEPQAWEDWHLMLEHQQAVITYDDADRLLGVER
ncbi:hypothetical protein [Streptomyces microflavus]|uniref:hypothetical protein n=1 Tax=Streptomyces microflavus TaxID=1919 RepID=UPI0036BAB6EF